MADRDSSAVGFRLRGLEPPELSTYPDRVKLQFWQWVTDAALRVKDLELSKGWDKDGTVHPLKPATIAHRKSEVGPVTRTAPRLEPALNRSRVRSLLRGRAHHQSAELFWDFDAVTGDSFAVILHYAAEAGHDVFGISSPGTAQVRREALAKWQAWKVQAGETRPRPGIPGALPVPKREVKRPVAKREVRGRMDIENFDLSSSGEKLKQAIEAGRFSGFRRLNARGEQWRPGTGLPPAPPAPKPTPKPVPKSTPKPAPKPAAKPRDINAPASATRPGPGRINLPITHYLATGPPPMVSREEIIALAATAKASAIREIHTADLRIAADQIGPFQDLINKRIAEYYRDNPSTEPIIVIQTGEHEYSIAEGHHRAVGAILAGRSYVPALVFRRKPGTKTGAELV